MKDNARKLEVTESQEAEQRVAFTMLELHRAMTRYYQGLRV